MTESEMKEIKKPIYLVGIPTLCFAMVFPSVMALTSFVLVAESDHQVNLVRQFVIPGGKVLQFVLPLFFILYLQNVQIFATRLWKRSWHWGILSGLLIALVMVFLFHLGVSDTPYARDFATRLYTFLVETNLNSRAGFLMLGAFTAFVHSFLEEYYWRWFVFRALTLRIRLIPAMMLSSLAFMSYHTILLTFYLPNEFWTVVVPTSLAIGGLGFFWAWLYYRTGSLISVWLSHCLVDCAMIYAEYQLLEPFW